MTIKFALFQKRTTNYEGKRNGSNFKLKLITINPGD